MDAIKGRGYTDKQNYAHSFVSTLFFSIIKVDGSGKMFPVTSNFTLKEI